MRRTGRRGHPAARGQWWAQRGPNPRSRACEAQRGSGARGAIANNDPTSEPCSSGVPIDSENGAVPLAAALQALANAGLPEDAPPRAALAILGAVAPLRRSPPDGVGAPDPKHRRRTLASRERACYESGATVAKRGWPCGPGPPGAPERRVAGLLRPSGSDGMRRWLGTAVSILLIGGALAGGATPSWPRPSGSARARQARPALPASFRDRAVAPPDGLYGIASTGVVSRRRNACARP